MATAPSGRFRLFPDQFFNRPREPGVCFFYRGASIVVSLETLFASSVRKITSFRAGDISSRHFFNHSLFHFLFPSPPFRRLLSFVLPSGLFPLFPLDNYIIYYSILFVNSFLSITQYFSFSL